MKEYKIKINGNDYNVVINDIQDSQASVEVNGSPFKVEFEKPITKPKMTAVKVVKAPNPAVSAAQGRPSAATNEAPAQTSGTVVPSPLPGVILEISVNEGDSVKAGQKLLVLEAMKMENVIESPADGTVKSIKVNKGESVLEGAPLVIIG